MNLFVIIALVIAGLTLALYIFALVFSKIKYSDKVKKRVTDTIYNTGSTKTERTSLDIVDVDKWAPVYNKLEKIGFIKKTINSLEEKYEIILRDNVRTAKAKAAKDFTINVLIGIVGVTVAMMASRSIQAVVIGGVVAIGIYHSRINTVLFTLTSTLQIELEYLITRIRYHYSIHGSIISAIKDAANECTGIIKNHALAIADALETKNVFEGEDDSDALEKNDIEANIDRFIRGNPNKFIKSLFSLAAINVIFGENKADDENTFLNGLRDLRADIQEDNLTRKDHYLVTKGRALMALIPLTFIKPAEAWSKSLITELASYFSGVYGILVFSLSIVACIVVYFLINEIIKYNYEVRERSNILVKISEIRTIKIWILSYYDKNFGKRIQLEKQLLRAGSRDTVVDLFIKRVASMIAVTLFTVAVALSMIVTSRGLVINDNSKILTLTANNSKTVQNDIVTVHTDIIDKYKDKKISLEDITIRYSEVVPESALYVVEGVSSATFSQIRSYQNIYLRVWHFMICITLGVASFWIPMQILKLREKSIARRSADEVIDLQSILTQLVFHGRMSIKVILNWFERFSDVFKPQISIAVSSVPTGEIKALEVLADSVEYEPFKKLIHNLIMSDRIGIKHAFAEIENDRKNYQETRKQDNRIRLNSVSNKLAQIDMIPFWIVLGGYMLGPLVLYTVSVMTSVIAQVETFM